MKPRTYELLTEVRDKTGKEYGKLVQKLLAIALLETNVESLVERSIQGIDLDVTIAGRRYAFEVKTSESDSIKLGTKDIDGLERQVWEGAEAYLAVLGGGLLDEWIFVKYRSGELAANKKLTSFQMRPFRDRDLERRVRGEFEKAVERHATTAIFERQAGLDKVLAGYPARRLA